MTSILLFAAGAALLVYSAEKLIKYLVGAARGLHVSVFLLAIVFTGIEFDDVALGVVLNIEDLGEVALGTVFGTAIAMTGIVLALAAIVTPTRVSIPRSYIALFAASPLVMIPFVLTAPLTAGHGVVLVLLFVAFLGYVATKELRSTAPVFRNAEILERIGASDGEPPGAGTDRPTDTPPFTVTVPFTRATPLPGWGGPRGARLLSKWGAPGRHAWPPPRRPGGRRGPPAGRGPPPRAGGRPNPVAASPW